MKLAFCSGQSSAQRARRRARHVGCRALGGATSPRDAGAQEARRQRGPSGVPWIGERSLAGRLVGWYGWELARRERRDVG